MSAILLIDTSLQGAIVGCVDVETGSVVSLQGAHHKNLMGSAEALPGLVADVLKSSHRRISDIDGIAVSVGPGSFTGIKVGLSFTYGLRKAGLGKMNQPPVPVLGLSALQACASEHCPKRQENVVDLLVPATKTHGFGVQWCGTSSAPRLIALSSYQPEPGTSVVIAGEWRELRQENLPAGVRRYTLTEDEVYDATLRGMSKKAAFMWPTFYSEENPQPSYLRLSTAEEALMKPPKLAASSLSANATHAAKQS